MCWTDTERLMVADGAKPHQVDFLNPNDPVTDLNDHLALFGRDMFQIANSDAVIIDARERRGIGIGVELLAALHFGKFAIGVLPRNSYYRQDEVEYRGGVAKNYVHPHFASLLTACVDDFAHAGRALRELSEKRDGDRIASSTLDQAITAYKDRLFPHDKPMKELFKD
jgi:hypothetical protein